MNRNHIGQLDVRIGDHYAKTEEYKREIDETIAQLNHTIDQAKNDIHNLQGIKNALTYSTFPEYQKPDMPKVTTLPEDGDDTHVGNVLTEEKPVTEDAELNNDLVDEIDKSLSQSNQGPA